MVAFLSQLLSSSVGPCDVCGIAGAFMSMLAFGSFGAPIKSEAAKSVDVDPLVFQSYKTFMCFVTSWLVLAFGEPFSFTPMGIASATFWVPGGVAAIAGIKMAGLAVAMGTLSSFIVLVSFYWGIFVYSERIHSREWACFAIFLMMLGLCGMSYYSSMENKEEPQSVESNGLEESSDYRRMDDDDAVTTSDVDESNPETQQNDNPPLEHRTEVEPLVSPSSGDQVLMEEGEALTHSIIMTSNASDGVIICGKTFPRRGVGIACSVFCGVWGGSIMAPEKLAKANTSGIGYLISFGIGAAIVTIALWMIRFSYHWIRLGSAKEAYQALPSFHIRVMWLPGCTAGLLWSIGNFFSLISVKYLGEGVGYSVTQSAMLVSGLWGIFYFKEVTGARVIMKWFLSASLTVTGIILLSYEHHKK